MSLKKARQFKNEVKTKLWQGKVENGLPENQRRFAERFKEMRKLSEMDLCSKGRDYGAYNVTFSRTMSLSLLSAAKRISIEKRKQRVKPVIQILEEGMGYGIFVQTFREKLNSNGIKNRITAIDSEPFAWPELRGKADKINLRRRKSFVKLGAQGQVTVDEFHQMAAEHFEPKRHFDMIFLMYSTANYMIPEVRREHLLKNAHSLSRNGFMQIEVKTGNEPNSLVKPFFQTPKGEINLTRKEIPLIKREFERDGFVVKIMRVKFSWKNTSLHYRLIVTRKKGIFAKKVK
ncbi:MAG: hypothetical protein WCI04_03165 [archaeon]